jgi:truncated hemoglobin YjbI
LFIEEFGHPMLRARHLPFLIGESERVLFHQASKGNAESGKY